MATCSVVNCDQPASTTVVLHPRESFGRTAGTPICDRHNFHMSVENAPWANMPDRGGILMGSELDQAGLLLIDQAQSDGDGERYISGVGNVSRLVLNGRTHGSGEPRTIEVLLTEDVIKAIVTAVSWLPPRAH